METEIRRRRGGGIERPQDWAEAAPAAASDHRSLLLLRGGAALLFAFLVFFWPKLTVTGLAVLWGGYSLVDGTLALTAATLARSGGPRLWLTAIGLAGLTCAAGALFALDLVTGHLAGIIALWAVSTGAMQLWAAHDLSRIVDRGWVLALDGVGAILFGLALALWPAPEVQVLVWVTGWFALALGSLFTSIAIWLGRSS